jgi:hypothetical protein
VRSRDELAKGGTAVGGGLAPVCGIEAARGSLWWGERESGCRELEGRCVTK